MKKFLPKTSTNTQGFTLVELLIVIAIISVLAVIGITIYSGIQSKARDARRQSDIDAIASAYESAKPTGSTYAALTAAQFSAGAVPTDTTTAKYSICASTAGANVNQSGYNPPTTWAAGTATPTAAAVNCDAITPTAAWAVIDTAAVPATLTTVKTWTICARLETGTFYCRSNGQ